jgi:diguanylate cyclase (GGDEF)-like protein
VLDEQFNDHLENQLMKALNTAALFLVLWRLLFSGFYSFIQQWQMAMVSFVGCLLWIWIFFLTKKQYHYLPFILCIVECMVGSILATFLIGWGTGPFFSLILLLPIIMLNGKLKKHVRILFSFVILGLIISLFLFSIGIPQFTTLVPLYQNILFLGNMGLGCTALIALVNRTETEKVMIQSEFVTTNQKLLTLANTDPLTDLLNRRVMLESIEKEKVDKGGANFSLIMVDVDNFKQINDEFGHEGGDFVLRRLSELIRMSVRSYDLVSRWGGDEFLIMLLETDLSNCQRVAEKLRLRVVNSPFVYHMEDIPVTITLGISVCNKDSGIGNALRKADLALYKGKQMGKNRSTSG